MVDQAFAASKPGLLHCHFCPLGGALATKNYRKAPFFKDF